MSEPLGRLRAGADCVADEAPYASWSDAVRFGGDPVVRTCGYQQVSFLDAPVDFNVLGCELTLFMPRHDFSGSLRSRQLSACLATSGNNPSAGLVLTTTDFDPMVSPQQSLAPIDPYW